ncbi:MAG: radical SAM family heme chaperone HemW [Candidatus Sericytochromatia bacterium]|nr:radical SAM family heme chaperone HemW [Candidatus Sericytochromatia bacterium]
MSEARSLYIHLPFCLHKCHYCDFVVRVLHRPSQIDRYLEHLMLDLQALSAFAAPLQTVYLGGGTPALLSVTQIQRLAEMLQQTFDLRQVQEWTLEANPEHLPEAELAAWMQLGVNRISLGVQTFDPLLLATCGRSHSPADIAQAVRLIQAHQLNLSLDLIYGLPDQSLQSWSESLTAALALQSDHLSLYALEVHPDTVFGHRNLPLPEDDETVAMYELACERLTQAGYQHYEIANWSQPGRPSRHNRVYWQNQPFLAAGVGAHGYFAGRRYAHAASLRAYYLDCQAGLWPWDAAEPQPLSEAIEETVFLGLRLLIEGLDLRAFERRFQRSLLACYPDVLPRLLKQGHLLLADGHLRLSPAAVPVSNGILAEFLEPVL